MIQTKKTLAKKNKKIFGVFGMDRLVPNSTLSNTHQMHGGVNEFKKKETQDRKRKENRTKRKSSTKQKKRRQDHNSFVRIVMICDDGEDEENGKETSNLTHQPSYNEEEPEYIG
ncbi:hypothetical protein M0813_21061 [Anaeramoeba flamelloides]|uniref:Uncharacterized protein n=1 Tax=Anaeramoeba flamelloides TaxID=1746091 RepID=A0ABQ8YIK6_9EUKA|nr:hypothetical protein M0813_21061 [Anaeramoeba flamelloides]